MYWSGCSSFTSHSKASRQCATDTLSSSVSLASCCRLLHHHHLHLPPFILLPFLNSATSVLPSIYMLWSTAVRRKTVRERVRERKWLASLGVGTVCKLLGELKRRESISYTAVALIIDCKNCIANFNRKMLIIFCAIKNILQLNHVFFLTKGLWNSNLILMFYLKTITMSHFFFFLDPSVSKDEPTSGSECDEILKTQNLRPRIDNRKMLNNMHFT